MGEDLIKSAEARGFHPTETNIRVNEEEVTKGLRYDEYIADIIATCQYQKQQIDEMKKEIKKLQNKLEVKNNGND